MAPRQTSKSTASATMPAAPAATVSPIAVPKATKAAPAAPVPAQTPVVPTPVANAAAVVVAPETATAVSPFEEIGVKISSFLAGLKETQALLKALSKEYEKMKKTVDKTERKRANARTNPNGFAKPTKIVDELCTFCGVEVGSKMSRTDVTRFINSYIKEKNLNKPENKRVIVPDDRLRALLKLKAGDEVNYFKMQTYISPLFIKDTPAAA